MSKWIGIDEENNYDSFDEWTARDEPTVKSFHEKYGFDERDGPPEEEEEERGYQDDPDDVPLEELNYRQRY
jgi:hypothetical protein